MEKINLEYFGEKFNHLQTADPDHFMSSVREEGFNNFNKKGLPTYKTEEWKYTNVSDLFRKEYHLTEDNISTEISISDIDKMRLPSYENANELVFVNGKFNESLSTIRSSTDQLIILPLKEAANGKYKDLVNEHLGKSNLFINDALHALNTSFIYGGVFIYVVKGQIIESPVYLYHISDARENHILSQPRNLLFVGENSKLQLVETYQTFGSMDSFTNEVLEVVVNTNAFFEYYKMQNDSSNASHVGTTHIRQIGKSYAHTVVVSLNGGMIRNNTNIIMEAAGNEAHMYGLYLLKGNTHVDNHTLVDNRMPNCFSNELYKGVMDGRSTGVFSGKIFVRPDAQKTNAYQTNNNILLSDNASVNTKPQLEIFADDVKCSHGCTVGRLDEEALFYLRARGISKEHAQAMLLHAFASNVIEQIKIEPLREYAEQLIVERLIEVETEG
ncbi:MAG TPA: Fe-S cluster assembly protein SufD [Hanamia sp.]|nr:Fe-S cluster assembly protein SufD [Hanamia sp.]